MRSRQAASTLVLGGATNTLTSTDTPTWNMLVKLKAYAKDNYIRGVREKGGGPPRGDGPG